MHAVFIDIWNQFCWFEKSYQHNWFIENPKYVNPDICIWGGLSNIFLFCQSMVEVYSQWKMRATISYFGQCFSLARLNMDSCQATLRGSPPPMRATNCFAQEKLPRKTTMPKLAVSWNSTTLLLCRHKDGFMVIFIYNHLSRLSSALNKVVQRHHVGMSSPGK